MEDLSRDVIVQAAGGDMHAFELLYTHYASFVYNCCYRILNRKEDADEVLQEVFLTVHKKLHQFQFQSSLKTWIYRISVNLSINRKRKNSRLHDNHVPLEESFNSEVATDQFKDLAAQEYQSVMIEKLFNHLTPEQKECLYLRTVEGFSYQEIAESLDINLNTVRTRLKRARESLMNIKQKVYDNEL